MSFFSFTFILFFLIVISIYWLISSKTPKLQNLILFIASLVFVGFVHYYFAGVLLLYAIFVYLAQKAINKSVTKNLAKHLVVAREFSQQQYSLQVAQFCQDKQNLATLESLLQESETSVSLDSLIAQAEYTKTLQQILQELQKILKQKQNGVADYNRLLSSKLLAYYTELYNLTQVKDLTAQDLCFINQNFRYADSLSKDLALIPEKDLSQDYKQKSESYTEVIEQKQLSAQKFFKIVNKSLVPGYGFAIAIFLSLLPLIYFKYHDFIYINIVNFFHALGFATAGGFVNVIPILGISYYTFNSISLLVSVKRGEIKSPSLLTTLTFVTYFPTIVAGPINRATVLIPQLSQKRKPQNVNLIFYFLTLGIAKKWLLATSLSMYFVQPIFGSPDNYNSIEILLGVYAYAFQLYFDFSGYTDLMFALGLSFGITHPQNFNNPYISLNIKDFWTRWHMSLSSWIRDYIYIPLGGNRHGFMLAQCYTVIAMVLSGIWHGSTLNFALWGVLHTIGIIGVNLLNKASSFRVQNYSKYLARLLTFNYVCLTWIFFNSDDLPSALNLIENIFTNIKQPLSEPLAIASLIAIFIYWSLLPKVQLLMDRLYNFSTKCRTSLFITLCIFVLCLTINFSPSGVPPFIYASF